jgi:hypothetical protein
VKEVKLHQVLDRPAGDRFEASGVCTKDGIGCVIFDNSPYIACIGLPLSRKSKNNRLIRLAGLSAGYEDIAYDSRRRRFFVLIEGLEFTPGTFQAKIEEFDDNLNYLSSGWADFPLRRRNKGLEGLACVYRDGKPYLLGLCEGNKCKGGAAGRVPGGGRIQVFKKRKHRWDHVRTIKLPKTLLFEDYASLDVMRHRIAVVSQASSLLWIGSLKASSWNFADQGYVYQFPRNHKGNTVYCNIEGVAWLNPDRVIVVSDKTKPDEQGKRCRKKDQSIHMFDIPKPR